MKESSHFFSRLLCGGSIMGFGAFVILPFTANIYQLIKSLPCLIDICQPGIMLKLLAHIPPILFFLLIIILGARSLAKDPGR